MPQSQAWGKKHHTPSQVMGARRRNHHGAAGGDGQGKATLSTLRR